MTPVPLAAAQRDALAALVADGRLRTVPADPGRASLFMAQAADRLSQLPLLTSDHVRYSLAYDAAHDVGEALLAAYGLRTSNGPGQHATLGEVVGIVIDAPPAAVAAAAAFDQHRRARNQQNYRATATGAAQARAIEDFARTLHSAAVARRVGDPG